MPTIAIIGPSGAGKSRLINQYLDEHPDTVLHKTTTTRPRRSRDDNSHHFVSERHFTRLSGKNAFVFQAEAFGHNYGIGPLPDDSQRIIFMLLRARFIPVLTKLKPDAIIIEIEADYQTLRRRLLLRDDKSRIDQQAIEQEIAAGRKIANYIINTDSEFNESYLKFNFLCDQILANR